MKTIMKDNNIVVIDEAVTDFIGSATMLWNTMINESGIVIGPVGITLNGGAFCDDEPCKENLLYPLRFNAILNEGGGKVFFYASAVGDAGVWENDWKVNYLMTRPVVEAEYAPVLIILDRENRELTIKFESRGN